MTEKTFVKQLEKIFEQEGFFTRQEVGVGYGVADLVIIKKEKVSPANCVLRKRCGQFGKLLREEYFKVLQFLPDENSGRKPASVDYLIEKTHLSKSFLKYTILRPLEEKKYIKSDKGKFYFKVNGWMPIASEVIAIEAKMRDWQRGLAQANRYKTFADKVYLAIPADISNRVDKGLLKKHNIGLITLDPESNTKKISLAPRKARPMDDFKKNLAIEFFWPRLLREFAL